MRASPGFRASEALVGSLRFARRNVLPSVLLVLLLICSPLQSSAQCPTSTLLGQCSGRGLCRQITHECECADGFYGSACQYKYCPVGKGRVLLCLSLSLSLSHSSLHYTTPTAWIDFAQGNNNAHNDHECSNQGICDRTTGFCTCRLG